MSDPTTAGSAAAHGRRLLVRADAGVGIGAGHVMRCLALAQAWQDAGGEARFLMASGAPAFQPLLNAESVMAAAVAAPIGSATDAEFTARVARELRAHWLVLDGYRFGADFQRAVAGAATRTAVIDDNAECAPYGVDLVINQNVHAQPSMVRDRPPGSAALLGSPFVLLRRPFLRHRGAPKVIAPHPRRLLVTMGAADPDNVTGKVIASLASLSDPANQHLQVIVVVGAVNPNAEALARVARDCPCAVEIRRAEPDMPGLMAWAEIAVAAAGSTTWELLFMGVPTVSVVIADNQRAIAAELGRREVVRNLGWHADVTPAQLAQTLSTVLNDRTLRAALSARGQSLVDGEGAGRVVRAMLQEGGL
ncbi:MAG TPA: UDP-2,4-diacetamido-2,4,6-trideoxy-beta-L-altropyranose hydrolase [Polyangia bacterium]|jgi:UDP-2,4-diacetamido-2,4,6-trideoxy-beta-L-altropyranose hydrolase